MQNNYNTNNDLTKRININLCILMPNKYKIVHVLEGQNLPNLYIHYTLYNSDTE